MDEKIETVRIVILTEAKRKRIIELADELKELVQVLDDTSNLSENTLQYPLKDLRHRSK